MTFSAGPATLYKWMKEADVGVYAPEAPHPGQVSRFCDGTYPSLYLAASPEGAMAEYFRVFPSFLPFQEGVKVRLFEVDVVVSGPISDVRAAADAIALGISPDRLTSSDHDTGTRWADCQSFASTTRSTGSVGIAYPAASMAAQWNLVLFDEPDDHTWVASGSTEVAKPKVNPADVVMIVP